MTQSFVERPFLHDAGEKVIFAQRGEFDGEDFLKMIVRQPQSARFITGKLWKFFAGGEPAEPLAGALADSFRHGGNEFKPLLRTMFRSQEFYAPALMRNQVKSPVQWLVSSVRMLERELPPPFVCFGLTRNLGQDLFAPPNVKGWEGGLSWITTSTLLARYNEAAVLVQGDLSMAGGGLMANRPQMNQALARRIQNTRLRAVEPEKLFTEQQRADQDVLVSALEKRLLQAKLKPKQEKVLRDYLGEHDQLTDDVILNAIRLVMSTPEFQLA
jgi:uncharacterized protein (DUF1800 family)